MRELAYLPSAPKILPRLKELLADPNSPMRDIVMLMRLDAGIVTRVLHVANSVYYNQAGTHCVSVDDAVTRVGYEQIYEMVSFAVASQVLVRPLVVYGIEADELWKLSVTAALAADNLAALVGEDRNIAYTTGLLHGVGMVAIDEWAMHHHYELTLKGQGLPNEFLASERATLGCTQAEVGAALLSQWGFPVDMVEPLLWQYTPGGSAGYARLAALLHAAKWVRSMVCYEGTLPPLPASYIMQMLQLTPTQLVRAAGEVNLKLLALRHLLEF